jgi:hypothetical protein
MITTNLKNPYLLLSFLEEALTLNPNDRYLIAKISELEAQLNPKSK